MESKSVFFVAQMMGNAEQNLEKKNEELRLLTMDVFLRGHHFKVCFRLEKQMGTAKMMVNL